jgi:hypothetical protein
MGSTILGVVVSIVGCRHTYRRTYRRTYIHCGRSRAMLFGGSLTIDGSLIIPRSTMARILTVGTGGIGASAAGRRQTNTAQCCRCHFLRCELAPNVGRPFSQSLTGLFIGALLTNLLPGI